MYIFYKKNFLKLFDKIGTLQCRFFPNKTVLFVFVCKLHTAMQRQASFLYCGCQLHFNARHTSVIYAYLKM